MHTVSESQQRLDQNSVRDVGVAETFIELGIGLLYELSADKNEFADGMERLRTDGGEIVLCLEVVGELPQGSQFSVGGFDIQVVFLYRQHLVRLGVQLEHVEARVHAVMAGR